MQADHVRVLALRRDHAHLLGLAAHAFLHGLLDRDHVHPAAEHLDELVAAAGEQPAFAVGCAAEHVAGAKRPSAKRALSWVTTRDSRARPRGGRTTAARFPLAAGELLGVMVVSGVGCAASISAVR